MVTPVVTQGERLYDEFVETIADFFVFTMFSDEPSDEEVTQGVDIAERLVEHLLAEGWLPPRFGA